MSVRPHRRLFPLALLLWVGLVAPARAAGGVEDGAGLFQEATRLEADKAIDEIRHRAHKDLLIESISQLSPDELKEYREKKDEAERARFFHDLAVKRARHWQVNGVYVLLCAGSADEGPRSWLPRPLRKLSVLTHREVVGHAVVVWPEANAEYFPEAARADLDHKFADVKGAKERDKALLDAVAFAGEVLETKARELGAPPIDTFRWTDAVWAAAALAGAWGVLGVFRARVAARQGTPAPVPGANQGLAALFGMSAALWLFEAYLARRHAGASAPVPQPAAAEPPPPADDAMHPDDLAALNRGPGPWATEDAEATTGHDLP